MALVIAMKAGERLIVNDTTITVQCSTRLRLTGERADITFPNGKMSFADVPGTHKVSTE